MPNDPGPCHDKEKRRLEKNAVRIPNASYTPSAIAATRHNPKEFLDSVLDLIDNTIKHLRSKCRKKG